MILTCPECATRYFLPDVQIGVTGRKVKCAQCGASWREFGQADPEAAAAAVAAARGQSAAAAPPPAAAGPEPEPDNAPSPAAARRAEILRDKKAQAERRSKQAATVNAAVWAGLVAAVAFALVLSAVFREQVVRLWPAAASAYAAVGLPVNAAGLLIEKVGAAPSMLEGHKALTVTGVLRNVAGAPVTVPAFRVDILDKAGRTLDHKIIQITAPPLKAGEIQAFSLGVADPPAGYQDVAVTFALPRAGDAPGKAKSH
jgi:predicted Zn finger-like uncharacterized protein